MGTQEEYDERNRQKYARRILEDVAERLEIDVVGPPAGWPHDVCARIAPEVREEFETILGEAMRMLDAPPPERLYGVGPMVPLEEA